MTPFIYVKDAYIPYNGDPASGPLMAPAVNQTEEVVIAPITALTNALAALLQKTVGTCVR